MNIVLLGPPGVGKGTYADILSKKYGIPHISSGEIFRQNIKNETELGKKVKEYMDRGNYVPDEITIEMMKKRLQKDDCKNGFLLDGFPRTVPQVETLEKFKKIHKVLNFIAPQEVIMERLGGRRTCRKCGKIYHVKNIPSKVSGVCDHCGGELYQREDEKPEAIKIRMKKYVEKTKPLLDYFEKKELLANIDAKYPIEEVDKIISQCENALKK